MKAWILKEDYDTLKNKINQSLVFIKMLKSQQREILNSKGMLVDAKMGEFEELENSMANIKQMLNDCFHFENCEDLRSKFRQEEREYLRLLVCINVEHLIVTLTTFSPNHFS